MNLPGHLWNPLPQFAESFAARCTEGIARLATSKVAFVGLARNCGGQLAANLERLKAFVPGCREWCLHIESNDCDDNTVDVLADFCRTHRQATFHYQMLGRKQFSSEFAGPRTIALAEYRDACQRWLKACASDADYVVVVDWDAWGGWSHAGLENGIGWLVEMQGAYGMASVSLFEHDFGGGRAFYHYDCWALRLNDYWDDYTNGIGHWKYQWLPAVGSSPALVRSAFGGLAIYRTDAYLAGTYDGTTDCEHVSLHRSVAQATGQNLYLCPGMRMLMHWLPEDAHAGHRIDGV